MSHHSGFKSSVLIALIGRPVLMHRGDDRLNGMKPLVKYLSISKRFICLLVNVIFSFWFCGPVFAVGDDQPKKNMAGDSSLPSIGNFSLPTSQQPGPLLSFGQTLIGRNEVQLAISTYSPYHLGGAFDNTNTTMTYGITDNLSLYFSYPLKTSSSSIAHRRVGVLDINLQLEQALYSSGSSRYSDLATIVGAVTLPTEHTTLQRFNKGYGSPSYFFGTTFNRTYVDWMMFISPGAQLTTSSDHVRLGSQWLYQAGLGRNILTVNDQSILFGLLELNGQCTERTKIFDHDVPNTGGNVIALTPSIWFSSKRLIVQAGVSFPVVQNLNGNQQRLDYSVAGTVSWTIS